MDFYSIQLNYLIEMISNGPSVMALWPLPPSNVLRFERSNGYPIPSFFETLIIFTCGIAFEICWFSHVLLVIRIFLIQLNMIEIGLLSTYI